MKVQKKDRPRTWTLWVYSAGKWKANCNSKDKNYLKIISGTSDKCKVLPYNKRPDGRPRRPGSRFA